MGAGRRRKSSTAQQGDMSASLQQQKAETKQKAREQYGVDKRSQYANLPQGLRDTVNELIKKRDQRHLITSDPGSSLRGSNKSEVFGLDKVNKLKSEVDQYRSENPGIDFGPGRANRGDITLDMLEDRLRKGN